MFSIKIYTESTVKVTKPWILKNKNRQQCRRFDSSFKREGGGRRWDSCFHQFYTSFGQENYRTTQISKVFHDPTHFRHGSVEFTDILGA